jgi:membrane fusion protein, epimerase transport system
MAGSVFDLLLPSLDVARADHPRRLVRAGLIAIVLLVLGVAAWSALAPISGAAIAPGVVKVDMNRKTVQHQEGGMVGEILVRDGDKVKAGQTLVVLRDIRVDAGSELAKTQLDADLAKVARLAAEQAWRPDIVFSEELVSRRDDPRVAQLLQREIALFEARRGAYDNQLALIRAQIRETEAEIEGRKQQLRADLEAMRLLQEELSANESLVGEGFVSKVRIITLQRSRAEMESRRGENESELSRARQKVSDLRLRAETMRSALMQESSGELSQVTAKIFDLRERLRPAQDAEQRQRITAPIDGEVVDLRITSIGGVIGPREAILDIVPENPDLIVEARVRPEDITVVRTGAEANVRLTSFRQRLTPTVTGTVIYVSADRLEDKVDKTVYYLARVRVTPEVLRRAGNLSLQAGMPAEVFVKSEARTALEYLLDPVTGFLQRSMREH